MTITFLTVGKPAKGWAADAVAHYTRFLSKYARVSVDSVKAVSGRNRADIELQSAESERLLEKLRSFSGAAIIVCDSRGKPATSETFAVTLRNLLDGHGGHAVVVIGGAVGVDESVVSQADHVWSLGPQTLPHDLALITAMEQTARAFSILRGELYHK